MSLGNLLYDKPWLGQKFGRLGLYISGSLPAAKVGLAYEGRLSINNAVGSCWVEILEGVDLLPPGYSIYVDNATKEVVLAWPDYNATPVPLANPGFETGDLTGWTYSTVGGAGTLGVASDHNNSGDHAAYWPGGSGLGSEGGIECVAVNDTYAKVRDGTLVTGRVTSMYNPDGGTPKGSRAQSRLHWFTTDDASGEPFAVSYGKLIKTRAYNGIWVDTVVSERAPVGTKSVRLAAWVTAKGGASRTYFDDATWDAPTVVGTNLEAVIPLTIRVHDAGGRAADWSGIVLIRGLPKWLLAPVDGGYMITGDPLVLTGTKMAKPAGVGSIATVSSVHGASYLHAGASSAVTFDDGNTWHLVSGTLPNFRIMHNGNKFYTSGGRLCSVDGITFTAIPNLPAGATVGIVNPVDHTIAAYDSHYVYLSTDEGATWSQTYTINGPSWSNRGEQMDIDENGQVLWSGYDGFSNNRYYYSNNYGIGGIGTVGSYYGARYGTGGIWLIQSYPDGYDRWSVAGGVARAISGVGGSRSDNKWNYDGDGKWGIINGTSSPYRTYTSTDNTLTWTTSPTTLTSTTQVFMTPMYP